MTATLMRFAAKTGRHRRANACAAIHMTNKSRRIKSYAAEAPARRRTCAAAQVTFSQAAAQGHMLAGAAANTDNFFAPCDGSQQYTYYAAFAFIDNACDGFAQFRASIVLHIVDLTRQPVLHHPYERFSEEI